LQPEKVVLSGVRRLVAAFRFRPEACYSGQVSPQNEKRRPVAALQTVRLIYAQASFNSLIKGFLFVFAQHCYIQQ
jgi:hypothetical protein